MRRGRFRRRIHLKWRRVPRRWGARCRRRLRRPSSGSRDGARSRFRLRSGASRGDLPPAVALALEPKVERVISLELGDVVGADAGRLRQADRKHRHDPPHSAEGVRSGKRNGERQTDGFARRPFTSRCPKFFSARWIRRMHRKSEFAVQESARAVRAAAGAWRPGTSTRPFPRSRRRFCR